MSSTNGSLNKELVLRWSYDLAAAREDPLHERAPERIEACKLAVHRMLVAQGKGDSGSVEIVRRYDPAFFERQGILDPDRVRRETAQALWQEARALALRAKSMASGRERERVVGLARTAAGKARALDPTVGPDS